MGISGYSGSNEIILQGSKKLLHKNDVRQLFANRTEYISDAYMMSVTFDKEPFSFAFERVRAEWYTVHNDVT